jgi:hypothetical protein
MPEGDGVRAALAILERRRMVVEAEGVVGIAPERAGLTEYYAATVAPLLEAETATILRAARRPETAAT